MTVFQCWGGIVIAKSKQKQGRIAGLERGWKCHAKEGEYISGDCKPIEEEPRRMPVLEQRRMIPSKHRLSPNQVQECRRTASHPGLCHSPGNEISF